MYRKDSNNTVYVCLSTNDKWTPFAAVTIASIMSNTKSKVHFFVMCTDLSDDSILKINALSKKFAHTNIEYISIDKKNLQQFNLEIRYISSDAFSRLLFPNICKNIGKVVYTDIDVVFEDDVAKIFSEDLEGHIIGAVEGISHANGQDNIRLKIDKQHSYFQSGILLIDCKKWRDANITSRCYEIMQNTSKLRYGDQDLLNIVFANNYKKLHKKYCVIPFQLKEMQTFSKESQEALANPFIIHYAGGNKPWITAGSLEESFWKYAAKTDFFLDIIKMRLNSDFVSKERNITTQTYKLFGVIPLIKIRRKFMYSQITERYFLFNFIPILKKVDSTNTIKWTSFFGLPVLRLTKEKDGHR